jgi:chemotaxis protein methyltransferase CheR
MVSEHIDVEIQVLLNAIYDQYGYDFRSYSQASIKRRVINALELSGLRSVPELMERVLIDPEKFKVFVSQLTVSVTEMFRDPEVYLSIRRHIIPILKTYPSIKIWHAGCATGEEVYSMAILLQEEGLYKKAFLYGTDINPKAIEIAKTGIYPTTKIQEYTANYQKAGGVESFSNYYTAKYDAVKINGELQKNILFTQHNLTTDEVFAEVHMLFCRNVLIYFSHGLQERVMDLFHRSLIRKGLLCLGTKETMESYDVAKNFTVVKKMERLYQKST